jgi:hypothetical protein
MYEGIGGLGACRTVSEERPEQEQPEHRYRERAQTLPRRLPEGG